MADFAAPDFVDPGCEASDFAAPDFVDPGFFGRDLAVCALAAPVAEVRDSKLLAAAPADFPSPSRVVRRVAEGSVTPELRRDAGQQRPTRRRPIGR